MSIKSARKRRHRTQTYVSALKSNIFTSAEMGTVDDLTVVTVWDEEQETVPEVTILYDGIEQEIVDSEIQIDATIVHYTVSVAGCLESTINVVHKGFIHAVENNCPTCLDPIGDALRADAKAYWKMDETSGARADSTGRGNNLASNGTPGSMSGKMGNALLISNDSSFLSINSNTDLQVGDGSFSFMGWVWISEAPLPGTNYILFYKTNGEDEYALRITEQLTVEFFIPDGDFGYPTVFSSAFTAAAWHFVTAYCDSAAQKLFISIDNGAFQETPITGGNAATAAPLIVGKGIGIVAESFAMDEWDFMKRIPTFDEYTYLYNAGAGRTLYP